MTLRGVSLFWSQWAPNFYNRDLISWLVSDWQIDVLRIPVAACSPGYLSDPDAELRKAETAIEAAISNGIYVIVDWHAHDPHTQQAIEFFTKVSSRWGSKPNLIYETWNEPDPKYGWDTIREHHDAVTKAIRSTAPNPVILCGTPDHCTEFDPVIEKPVNGENVAYTCHFYAGTHRDGLRRKLSKALGQALPIFVTEWAGSEADGGGVLDQAETWRWLEFLQGNSISHVGWSIHDKDETSAMLRPGASPGGGWRNRDLSASGRLVRAYLRQNGRDLGDNGVAGRLLRFLSRSRRHPPKP